MKADINSQGMLEISPMSITEESMTKIWLEDKTKNEMKIKDIVVMNLFEDIGPALVKSVIQTKEDVTNLSGDLKKAARQNVKDELDKLGIEYNGRHSTTTLMATLEKAKAAENMQPDKTPGEETPPDKEAVVKEVAAKEVAEKNYTSGMNPPIFGDVREALKRYAATEGTAKAKELLTKYGAVKVSGVKEESYASFIEDTQAGGSNGK